MCFSTEEIGDVKLVQRYYGVDHKYVYTEPENEYHKYFNNGFSHNDSWVITEECPNQLILVKWGIVPLNNSHTDLTKYFKETVKYGSGLNARSEKLFTSSHYEGFKKCLVPVKGFFEPHTARNSFKIPFYFKRKDDSPMSLAGMHTKTAEGLITYSILTKAATPLFAKIHNKKNHRPVILQEMDIEVWLDNNLNDDEIYNEIDDDLPDESLTTWPISKDLFKGALGQREDITEPVEYEELEIQY